MISNPVKRRTGIVCLLLLLQTAFGRGMADSSTTAGSVRGQLMITGGIGANIWGTLLQYNYMSGSYWKNTANTISGSSKPMFVIAADYGLGRRFSAGLAFGYQSAKVAVSDHYYISAGKPIPYEDRWKRLHFAVRGDFYFVQLERMNLYTGLKLGYSTFTMTSQRSEVQPLYTSQLHVKPLAVSVQAHIGCNYYFNPYVGLNTELGLGIGGPYLAEAGIVIRI